MNFKKKVSGSWTDTPHYIHNTSTDTITTLPADVYADGNNATVGLKGNTVQSGTPTPDNPITPEGCGERTGNLFDITAFVQGISPNRCTTSYDDTTNTLTINATGSDAHTGNTNSYHIPVTGGETYTLSWGTNAVSGQMYIFENGLTDSSHLHDWNSSLRRISITMRSDTTFIIVRLGCNAENTVKTYSDIRLNSGSTALPYKPYGYKIPISSANTTTPVYLGEVQTTRKIKQLVFDGTENWNEGTSNYYIFINVSGRGDGIPNSTALSTHTESGVAVNNNGTALFFKKLVFVHSSLADFKAYLAAQYAAGTPVTVWYVLAEPTTGVVNEPIRKIGDYADTVSGISIPTITGADSFDVLTTLKPSEVELTYTGWHDANVQEWDGSQWQ